LLSSPVIYCTFSTPLDLLETRRISSWGTIAASRGHNLRHRGPNTSWGKPMGRPPNIIRHVVVEDCEIVMVSDTSRCRRLGLPFSTVVHAGAASALCLLCPGCGRGALKLYRPTHLPMFGCRACHNLSYTTVQKHDARLDRLLKLPEREMLRFVTQDRNITWKLLAIRAGCIRRGVIHKY
jgi:hypothetical protein